MNDNDDRFFYDEDDEKEHEQFQKDVKEIQDTCEKDTSKNAEEDLTILLEEEVKIEVDKAISSTGAKGLQDIGKVMGMLSSKLAGKADGKLIAVFTKEALAKL